MKKYLIIIVLALSNSACFSQIYAVGNGDGYASSCVFWDLGAVVLPVNLLSFDVICTEHRTKLQWSIPLDFNNHNFTIERSIDGINFKPLSSPFTRETVNSIYLFTFNVETAPPGRTYYRLRQPVDNHQFDYSRVVTADCTQPTDPGISVYPNPTTGIVNIRTNTANTKLIIRNAVGQLVLQKELKQVSETVNLGQFPDGIYIVEIRSFNKSSYNKIVLKRN